MLNKKGIASLATFSLVLLLLFAVFIFSYSFYNTSELEINSGKKELELLNSAASFRGEISQLVVSNGSYLNYTSITDPQDIILVLENRTIIAKQDGKSEVLTFNLTSLGIDFCSEYNLSPFATTELFFNGSCVSISTN